MARDIWFLGGDERSFWAAEHFRANGWRVATCGVVNMEDEPLPAAFKRVVLPFPSVQGALLRGNAAIPTQELLCRVNEGTRVYGGQLSSLQDAIAEKGGSAIELYGSEPLTTQNAALTAEAAISLAVTHSPLALYQSKCLVTGYGRIGKLLAQRLQAMSAQVSVAARRKSDRALAMSFGHSVLPLTPESFRPGCFDFIFNTVPFPVLGCAQLERLKPHCLLVELASSPYGISLEGCQALGLKYLLASSLPGRFSPSSAGRLYAQSILELICGEETP